MSYSEEEITFFANILRNFNDGLNVYPPILENIPLKNPEKRSCENCGNTYFFKDHGFRYCNKCFYSVHRNVTSKMWYFSKIVNVGMN